MAAAVRNRISFISQNYIKSFITNSAKPHLHKRRLTWFHTSSVFNVVGQEVKMPSLSPTMTEGKIVKWLKKEGDALAPGDVLCEIQTDKAVMSFETEEEGILAKILVPENSPDIKVGTLIALTVSDGEDWKTVEAPGGGGGSSPTSASAEVQSPQPTATSGGSGDRLKYEPHGFYPCTGVPNMRRSGYLK
ncbi:hypothetical protein J6590_051848 [Homalodisca vitripennis]|nr:hypothetical protein J6590_051848 [Homalodisca vitripennis]